MKEIGNLMSVRELGMKSTLLATFIEVILKTERRIGEESTSGEMVKSMMENGSKGSNVDKGFGRTRRVTTTLVNGRTQRLMATEFIFGQMVTSMKVSGSDSRNTEEALKLSLMVMNIVANTIRALQTDKGSILGKTDLSTLVSSSKASNMDLESGRKTEMLSSPIRMREIINMTKSVERGLIHGQVGIITRATFRMMRDMVKVR